MVIFLGLLVGFLAAIPLGPLNIFAISQTLKHDFFHGLWVGLTASFLDIFYCFFAIMGLSYSAQFLNRFSLLLELAGSALLIIISIRLIKKAKTFDEISLAPKNFSSYSRPIIVAILLYASNPMLYVFWLAVAETITANQWVTHVGLKPYGFALACGGGSAVWYLILTRYISKFQKIIKPNVFRIIIYGLAIILIGLAAYNLGSFFIELLAL